MYIGTELPNQTPIVAQNAHCSFTNLRATANEGKHNIQPRHRRLEHAERGGSAGIRRRVPFRSSTARAKNAGGSWFSLTSTVIRTVRQVQASMTKASDATRLLDAVLT